MRHTVRVLKNAEIMPFQGTMDAFEAGVFDRGELVTDSLLYRASPPSRQPVRERLAGAHIFGGYLFAHYGHFLLESLSRVYVFRNCPDLPIIFLSANHIFLEMQKAFLRFLGVRNRIVFLKKPVSVERLLMSPPGSTVVPPFVSDEQLRALAVVNAPARDPRPAIWLSRSKLREGGVREEPEIERLLAERGWTIVHPEKEDFRAQAHLIGSAGLVAGFEGSAFYNVMFASSIAGRFFLFGRRNIIPELLELVLRKKNIPFQAHVFPVEHVSGDGATELFTLPEYRRIVETLEEARESALQDGSTLKERPPSARRKK